MKKTQNKQTNRFVSFILRFFALIILAFCITVPVMMVGPRLFDYMPYIVVSSSMEPTLKTGDVVYVEHYSSEEFRKGDLVCFYGNVNNTTPTTHRVVSNDQENHQLITKGDANQTEDITPVSYSSILGRVAFCTPKIGYIFEGLNSIYGKILYVMVLIIGILLYELS